MAFKMRSGNKVSFKNMGGSPAKQESEDTKLVSKGETDADIWRIKKAEKDAAKLQLQKESRSLKELRDYNVRQEQEASDRKRSLTEGVNVTDDDVNQYKSKEQLLQDRVTRNVERRQMEYGSDERKAQLVKDRDATLRDKLQRAKGTGRNTMTFDWRQALLGGDIKSGMRYEPAHEVLQRKIDKRAKKAKKKEARKKGQEERPGTRLSRTFGGKGSKREAEKIAKEKALAKKTEYWKKRSEERKKKVKNKTQTTKKTNKNPHNLTKQSYDFLNKGINPWDE